MKMLEQMDLVVEQGRSINTLGFSNIGNEDERHLWLDFRWCLPPKEIDASKKRTFRSGQQIEANVISDMKHAQFNVYDVDPNTGRQFEYNFHGGHFKGFVDCVVTGLPDNDKPVAFEIKSAKQTEFNKFKKHGVREWQPKYYTQANCAAAASQTEVSAVFVESKNDGARHVEYIPFDNFHWQSTLAKAARIIQGRSLPPSPFKDDDHRINNFFTDEQRRIYLKQGLPPVSCRNCHYAQPIIDESIDAKWGCSRHSKFLSHNEQKTACDDHIFLPELMPDGITLIGIEKYGAVYEFANGTAFINGAKTEEECFTSKDLSAISKTKDLTQETLFTTEMSKLQNIINVNSGKKAEDITCGQCKHFKPDPIGNGEGAGDCLQEDEYAARFPNQIHNCVIYQDKE